jgi:hypothetical protein
VTLTAVVVPGEARLIAEFQKWPVVAEIDCAGSDGRLLPPLPSSVRIRAVVMRTETPLSAIEYSEAWGQTAVMVQSPSMGNLRGLMAKLDAVARLNVRLCLPASKPESYVSLQILSSLGVGCGLYFDGRPISWDGMSDLLHYAIYTKVPHAPIEPFDYVASHFQHGEKIDFSDVYYDNPLTCARVDAQGRVSLCAKDAAEGVFLGTGAGWLDDRLERPEYRRHEAAWQTHFLQRTPCASCIGWRICLGKFADGEDGAAGCSAVFAEWLEASEYHLTSVRKVSRVEWPY